VKGPLRLTAPLVAALALAACNGGSSTMPGTAGQSALETSVSNGHGPNLWGPNVSQVCPDVPAGRAACYVLLEKHGVKYAGNAVAGITATNLEQAYDLPYTSKGSGQTVAIVDAYDNPNVASDLQEYRNEFDLGTAKFTKYNQEGQTSNYPTGDVHWGLEIDLDVQMVSAACPNCTIDLIEANSDYTNDLGAAEAEAVKLGAHIVSNSWGGVCSGTCGYGSDFDTKGVTYLASAGDGRYGVAFPMQLDTVVSVGGTVLQPDTKSKRGWSEVVWSDTGGGCATSVTKPAWQDDPKCSGNMRNDVAAVAQDVAEYDTYGGGPYSGWLTVQGTSIASPLSAGIFGLAGNATSQNGGQTFWKWRHEKTSHLYHISSGNDGTCSPEYFCTDGTHPFRNHKERDYGGPTGWGTPHGIRAF
jgi:subtilase family serine protease